MKDFIRYLAASLMLVSLTTAKAEIQYGLALIAGQTGASGTENEGTASDTSDRSKNIEEIFAGGDIFVEHVGDNFTFGVSYVPLEIDLGDGKRTDTNAGADIAAEADTGDRSAAAKLEDLFTFYVNYPLGNEGWYGLAGMHMATLTTQETLNTSSYGNEDLLGLMLGAGVRAGNLKYEVAYSKFEDIELSASGGGTNSIDAEADALTLRVSFGF